MYARFTVFLCESLSLVKNVYPYLEDKIYVRTTQSVIKYNKNIINIGAKQAEFEVKYTRKYTYFVLYSGKF